MVGGGARLAAGHHGKVIFEVPSHRKSGEWWQLLIGWGSLRRQTDRQSWWISSHQLYIKVMRGLLAVNSPSASPCCHNWPSLTVVCRKLWLDYKSHVFSPVLQFIVVAVLRVVVVFYCWAETGLFSVHTHVQLSAVKSYRILVDYISQNSTAIFHQTQFWPSPVCRTGELR